VVQQARPSFSELLAASLRPSAEMRAWFDDRLKYQLVQQSRVPMKLPKVGMCPPVLADGLQGFGHLACSDASPSPCWSSR
jgi:hypothetical protein